MYNHCHSCNIFISPIWSHMLMAVGHLNPHVQSIQTQGGSWVFPQPKLNDSITTHTHLSRKGFNGEMIKGLGPILMPTTTPLCLNHSTPCLRPHSIPIFHTAALGEDLFFDVCTWKPHSFTQVVHKIAPQVVRVPRQVLTLSDLKSTYNKIFNIPLGAWNHYSSLFYFS